MNTNTNTEENTMDNETPVLDAAATNAKKALRGLRDAGTKSLTSWTAYGVALAEGRDLFQSDEEFGKWIRENKLDVIAKHGDKVQKTNPHERSAAIWSSVEPDNFDLMKQKHPTVTTVRGLHAKWKQHIRETVAANALAEIEDTDTLQSELATLSETTGIDMSDLGAEVDKQVRRHSRDEDKARKEQEDRDAARDAIRAEVEAQMELEGFSAADPVAAAPDTALLNTMRTVLTFAAVDVINAALAMDPDEAKIKTHGNPAFPFWSAKLAKSKAEFDQRLSDLNGVVTGDPLGDDIAQSVRALALDGGILPGGTNPPQDFDLGDTFAATVMGAVRTSQAAEAAA